VLESGEEKIFEDALVEACISGNMTQMRRLASQGVRVSSGRPLVQAAAHGKLDVTRYLISDLGADVNQANDQGYTPLFVAAQCGHLAVVRCLVKDLGTVVDQATSAGFTPLLSAVQRGHLDVVRCLIEELGANVNLARKEYGAMALMMAASESHIKGVAYLMRHGADPKAIAPNS
jgi:ankyrin repeat protein